MVEGRLVHAELRLIWVRRTAMKLKTFHCGALAALVLVATASAADSKLWYRQPAGTNWVQALPIGNGRLGAMVFGGVARERLQLNEDTVWEGYKRDGSNPESLKAL